MIWNYPAFDLSQATSQRPRRDFAVKNFLGTGPFRFSCGRSEGRTRCHGIP
jgi:hypothetical protein